MIVTILSLVLHSFTRDFKWQQQKEDHHQQQKIRQHNIGAWNVGDIFLDATPAKLNAAEIEALKYMRQEEKMARAMEQTGNPNLDVLYRRLLRAPENHLHAFARRLLQFGRNLSGATSDECV